MGAMKSLHYRRTALGWRPGKREAELLGIADAIAPGLAVEAAAERAALVAVGVEPAPPRKTAEELEAERAAARERAESEREAREERAAIQAVEREAAAEYRASLPKVFAPDPPDFPRSKPLRAILEGMAAELLQRAEPDPEPGPDHTGLASPIVHARTAARDRRLLEEVRAGRIPPGLAELRSRDQPKPPPANSGWYQWGDGFCRIGSAPYPEYRYPGLSWRLHWRFPKPDDVPWEDEAADPAVEPPPPPPPPVAAAPRQHQPSRRETVRQAAFAW